MQWAAALLLLLTIEVECVVFAVNVCEDGPRLTRTARPLPDLL